MEYHKVKIPPLPSCAVHAANSLQKAAILISVKQIQDTSSLSEVSRLTRTLEVIYYVHLQPSFHHL